jgi:diguanylate cyclase (GGDEF)-like protein
MLGEYDLGLVALSLVVAAIASYTALDLAGRVSESHGKRSSLWLLGGALSMGTGIWSMHFIGMLAFRLPIAMAYDAWINTLSWLVAVAVSGIALFVVRRPTLTGRNLSVGAALMGVGIATMHYTGMAAMRMSPPIVYDPPLFVASVLIAIAASLAALWIAFQLRKKHSAAAILAKLGSALVMGIAITGMHYTGMAAAHFAPDSVCLAAGSGAAIGNQALASLVAVATVALLIVTLVISAFDTQLAARAAKHAEALQAANEQLRNIALYDQLTGLPNRLLLEDRVEQAMLRADRNNKPCALMFIDLDHFKPVNDTFGHRVGDSLLRAVAGRLGSCLRKEDTVARAGGDEFVIVLGELHSADDAVLICDKVLKGLSQPFAVERHALSISCSIGVSVYPKDGRTLTELMTNADVAMYHAKKSGRNGYRFFTPGLEGAAGRTVPQ